MREPIHDLAFEATIDELQRLFAERRLRCVDLVRWHLERIAAHDQQGTTLNSIIHLNPEAEADAERLDTALETQGPVGPLHGVPVVVKDNIDVASLPTTGGCAALRELRPRRDAQVVERLRRAGAVILAKTNMTEFAWGMIDTVGSALPGFTRNPYDTAYASGGSSGGSAVAVCANFAVAGLGTDTGCSVRAPASINALVGLRPTHGRVSCRGVMPMNADWDTVGPIGRSVADVAAMLDVIAGLDADDPLTAGSVDHPPPPYTSSLREVDAAELRLGVPRQLTPEADTEPEILALFAAALRALAEAGASVVDPLPMPELPTFDSRAWYMRFKFDLNSYLAAHGDASPHPHLASILESGEVHPYYHGLLHGMNQFPHRPEDDPGNAERHALRERIRGLFLDAMDAAGVDAVLYPTFLQPPKRNGDCFTEVGNNNAWAPECGFPAVNVPMGFTRRGLPLGLQLMARPWSEQRLLQTAACFEALTHHRVPPPI